MLNASVICTYIQGALIIAFWHESVWSDQRRWNCSIDFLYLFWFPSFWIFFYFWFSFFLFVILLSFFCVFFIYWIFLLLNKANEKAVVYSWDLILQFSSIIGHSTFISLVVSLVRLVDKSLRETCEIINLTMHRWQCIDDRFARYFSCYRTSQTLKYYLLKYYLIWGKLIKPWLVEFRWHFIAICILRELIYIMPYI